METTDFPVTIRPDALARIKRLIAKDGRESVVVRVGVKGGGCSGLEYVVRLDPAPRPNDLILALDGVIAVCDPKSAKVLEGSTLELSNNLIGGAFQFDNPNAKRSCGCGTSFLPKDA